MVAEQQVHSAGFERVALITGAGSGLGRKTAEVLAHNGFRIVASDINAEALQDTMRILNDDDGRHCSVAGDISEPDGVTNAVRVAGELTGNIDVLVNSAGVGEGASPTLNQSLADWDRVIGINLTGTFLMCKAAAEQMKQSGGGVIINLSSIAGILGLPMRSAYSASKAGVTMLTRVLASEWAPYGIRVNAVAPGYVVTPLTERLMNEGKLDVDAIIRRSPTGRMGSSTDVAEAINFLASDRASFISGAILPVDGAYMAHGAPSDAFPGVLDLDLHEAP